MKLLAAIFALTILLTLYALIIRPWMRRTPWGKRFLDRIEPIERTLFLNSETILRARLKVVVGILLTLLTWLGGIDVNDILPLVPDAYDGYVVVIFKSIPIWISLSGTIDEWMRRDVTKPLEVVAMRTDAPVEVKIQAAQAEAAMSQAVTDIKETGAA